MNSISVPLGQMDMLMGLSRTCMANLVKVSEPSRTMCERAHPFCSMTCRHSMDERR